MRCWKKYVRSAFIFSLYPALRDSPRVSRFSVPRRRRGCGDRDAHAPALECLGLAEQADVRVRHGERRVDALEGDSLSFMPP
jgi:hypothetical protein